MERILSNSNKYFSESSTNLIILIHELHSCWLRCIQPILLSEVELFSVLLSGTITSILLWAWKVFEYWVMQKNTETSNSKQTHQTWLPRIPVRLLIVLSGISFFLFTYENDSWSKYAQWIIDVCTRITLHTHCTNVNNVYSA